METKRRSLKGQQQGFAAIIIAIVLVVILGLLTVGFSDLMRNEQKQALNRQLSNQAFYAAESGINDAARALDNGYITHKTTCAPDTSGATGAQYLNDQNVAPNTPSGGSPTGDIPQWTCLLIDPAPTSVELGSVDTVTPTAFTITGVDAATESKTENITSLTIGWQDPDASITNFRGGSGATNNAFPTYGSWNAIGGVRVAITPLGTVGFHSPITTSINFNRDSLASNTFTAFLYPTTTGSGAVNYTSNWNQQGQIINGGCTANPASLGPSHPLYCQVTINNIPATTTLLLDLRSLYSATHVYITANGGSQHMAGAQALVDSTGRAGDVLRRIQARIPARERYNYPGFVADGLSGICKQIDTYPGSTSGCGLNY